MKKIKDKIGSIIPLVKTWSVLYHTGNLYTNEWNRIENPKIAQYNKDNFFGQRCKSNSMGEKLFLTNGVRAIGYS